MRATLFLLALFFSLPGLTREVVKVGGYEFPPYVELKEGKPTGVTLTLLEELNKAQDKYEFQFVLTAPRRRYDDFSTGKFEVIFFENPEWGWRSRQIPTAVSREFLRDSEVFISRTAPGRGESYFNTLSGKSMAGIYGYHYAFAGFNDDPKFLETQHGMSLVYSNQASIALVLAGRVDLAVITRSYLNTFLRRNAKAKASLLVSQRTDQVYSHRVMVRDGAHIKVSEIETLLDQLKRQGSLAKIWRHAGITE